ncbi:MAG: hypothetical protein OXU76_03320, partial [Alphaproteobacteria bacterium]|nr:hypothetical protein [Alphaproteobacteria bacterium]
MSQKSITDVELKEAFYKRPAVIILGAGASIASTLHRSEKNGKILPAMNNLIEVIGLEEEIKAHGFQNKIENFESFYSQLVRDGKHRQLECILREKTYEYFHYLELPDETTIYDYLILGLCGKDMIATFNWDPFLMQAYLRNARILGEDNLPELRFLHGNVSIGICYECKITGLNDRVCSQCRKIFTPSDLLFPVEEKNYNSNTFLKDEWNQLKVYLHRAYLVSFFGYSAPKTDVEARKLILNWLNENNIREQQEMEIIDIKAVDDKQNLRENWEEFPFSHH